MNFTYSKAKNKALVESINTAVKTHTPFALAIIMRPFK